ncbi:hypothetical protein AMAG_18526 [Allomyces macrogynus ATCC 38327]|uniref:F-box domain-containing protein n=1 Tax=Allomyces macrogynus (strain ATCC 38327) TaxID=578462 RepID=A0A0L0SCW0_ALLM3|nr:hypothetical protein AMAG_18526 [Allomyces macrogynus ATCC 38327]|eukprot:KNE60378.1 hypothetical protein AMAG_18526 [Allomyces macrogynus ATCC 38327]
MLHSCTTLRTSIHTTAQCTVRNPPPHSTKMTSTHDLAHSSARVPAVHQLPDVVVDCIAEKLVWDMQGSISLIELALAAPGLYAPCLYVAIRTFKNQIDDATTPYHTASADATLSNSEIQEAGNLFRSWDDNTGRLQTYLALIPRAKDRTPITTTSALLSRHWSLLPVPLRQWRHCSLDWMTLRQHDLVVPVPPQCLSLHLEEPGEGTLLWSRIPFPPTVTELALSRGKAPSMADAPMVFGRLPRQLQTLVLRDLFLDKDGHDDASMALLLDHAPATLVSLTLVIYRYSGIPIPVQTQRALCRLLLRLPRLTSLTLECGSLMGLDELLAAFRRVGLKHLKLTLFVAGEDNSTMLSPVATGSPSSVDSLTLDVDSNRDQWSADIKSIFRHFPIATHALNATVTAWDRCLACLLPFAPSLQHLTISSVSERAHDELAHMFPRFPASLKSLAISVDLGPVAAKALARYMPSQLVALDLKGCDLSAVVLDLLGPSWPLTLRQLILHQSPQTRPDLGPDSDPLRRNMTCPLWVALLPTELRLLEMRDMWITDGMVASWVERMSTRLKLRVSEYLLDERMAARLGTKFHVAFL